MPNRTGMRVDHFGIAKIESRCEETTRRVADAIGDDVDRFVPVDTGELKASKRVVHQGLASFVVIGTDHWIFVEYGTRYMAAEPYMRPALYRNRHLAGV